MCKINLFKDLFNIVNKYNISLNIEYREVNDDYLLVLLCENGSPQILLYNDLNEFFIQKVLGSIKETQTNELIVFNDEDIKLIYNFIHEIVFVRNDVKFFITRNFKDIMIRTNTLVDVNIFNGEELSSKLDKVRNELINIKQL